MLTLTSKATEYLEKLFVAQPAFKNRLATACEERAFRKINRKTYTSAKESIILAEGLLTDKADMPLEEQKGLVKQIFDESTSEKSRGVIYRALSYVQSDQPYSSVQRQAAKQQAAKIDDADFLSQLGDTVTKFPVLAEAASELVKQAQEYFKEILEKKVDHVASHTERTQLEEFKRQLEVQVAIDRKCQENESRLQFLEEVQDAYRGGDRTGG